MKKIFSLFIALTLLVFVASPALAVKPEKNNNGQGGPNGTFIRFENIDSYWKTTESGLIHEWRTTDNRHFIFKPVDKFIEADCGEGCLNSFSWRGHTNYDQSYQFDEADLEEFIETGKRYWVCVYEWNSNKQNSSSEIVEEENEITPEDILQENQEQNGHMIENKWDLSGSFVAHPGYNWKGLAEGSTWNYDIHIKEAISDEDSTGSIHFSTGDINFVGQVKETKRNYSWATLAAFGTTNYDEHEYYFMFFYDDVAVWLALSDTPYDGLTGAYTSGQRIYQLHSLNPGPVLFDIDDYKAIHEQ